MARASLGIAMGSAGSDAASESAGVGYTWTVRDPLTVSLALLLLLPAAAGAGVPSGLRLERVATCLDDPVAVTHAGDGRLFVTLQAGRVVVIEDGRVLPRPFLDITGRVGSGGERGLLSVAFHPRYAANGFFFVDYTNNSGDTVIARYSVSGNPDVASPASEVILMTLDQPFSNHNGGQLQFGPDGFLYVGTGDGGSGDDPECHAQDPQSLLGKILRIDVDRGTPPFFAVPPDNPFVGVAGIRDEIWALGLRNPWRFSFDRTRGDLFIGDVGQGSREEVSFQPASSGGGENYGWKMMEGNLCRNQSSGCPSPLPACGSAAYTAPILEYWNAGGECAVTGGYVYRGEAIAGLAGRYLYGDFCSGAVWAAERAGASWRAERLPFAAPGLTSFGEDSAGEIYLTAGGGLYRLAGPAAGAPGTLDFTATAYEAAEGDGRATVTVQRTGGSDGEVAVDYATGDGTATAPADYAAAAGTLTWAAGDGAVKSFTVAVVDDREVEGDEFLTVSLSSPAGGALLGERSSATLTLADDDVDTEPCVADANTLCLTGERFRVRMSWRTILEETGRGVAVPLTEDSGYFWFFSPNNPEVFVKVLDACFEPYDHFWVFVGGLTDVETHVTVVDTVTGEVQRYDKELGLGFDPIRDTSAFDTCP